MFAVLVRAVLAAKKNRKKSSTILALCSVRGGQCIISLTSLLNCESSASLTSRAGKFSQDLKRNGRRFKKFLGTA